MGTQRVQRTQPRRDKATVHLRASRLVAVGLLLPVLMAATGCGQQGPGGTEETGNTISGTLRPSPTTPLTSPPATPPTSGAPTAMTPPTTPATAAIDLSIALTESPDATPHQFRLVSDGSTPSPESTLPDPAAALAAVEQHGQKLFFPVPDPNRMCTEQYGGPQIAVVTGWFNGKAVNATFKRTNGCEIASWTALAPLFGALAGGTGAS